MQEELLMDFMVGDCRYTLDRTWFHIIPTVKNIDSIDHWHASIEDAMYFIDSHFVDLYALKEDSLEHPKDFMYYGDTDLDVWGFTGLAVSRDSDSVARANWKVIEEEVDNIGESYFLIERFNHWICGWIEQVMVNTDSTSALEWVMNTVGYIEDNMVIDEDVFSEVEQEDQEEAWDSWVAWQFRRDLEDYFNDCLPDYKDVDEDQWIATLSDSDLYNLFTWGMDAANVYWENDGSSMSIDINRIVKAVTGRTWEVTFYDDPVSIDTDTKMLFNIEPELITNIVQAVSPGHAVYRLAMMRRLWLVGVSED